MRLKSTLRAWIPLFPLLAMALATGSAWAGGEAKIGISLPLSGDSALLGEQFRRGAQLASRTLEQAEGIELLVFDDRCESESARFAARAMKEAEISIATGFLCNASARSAAEELAGSGIPVLVAGARSERILKDRESEGWSVWRLPPGDLDSARFAAEALSRRWRGNQWALADDASAPAQRIADQFRALMEESGSAPRHVERIPFNEEQRSPMARRLLDSGMSGAFAVGEGEEIALLWAEMIRLDRQENAGANIGGDRTIRVEGFGASAEAGGDSLARAAGARAGGDATGVGIEIVGGESLSGLRWSESAPEIPDGLLAILPVSPSSLPAGRELALRLLLDARASEEAAVSGRYVHLGYAAVQIAVAALRSGDPIRSLETGRFETANGIVQFDSRGRNLHIPYALHRWRGGKFEPVSESDENGSKAE